MRTIKLTCALLCLVSFPALAGTFHVEQTDMCPGSGTPAEPFCAISSCNDAMLPGDLCLVGPGTYNEKIKPTGDGNANGAIGYECPSRQCTVEVASGYAADAYNKSFIHIDGFDFANTKIRMSGPDSSSNRLERVVATDTILLSLGGTGLTIRSFDFKHSGDSTIFKLGYAGRVDQGTTLSKGSILGGSVNLWIGTCEDCVVDDVRLGGASEYSLRLAGPENLVVKNSIFLAASETNYEGPFVEAAHDLSLLNNAMIQGWRLPTPGYECGLTGEVVLKNNIFNNAGRRAESASAKLGHPGACDSSIAEWPPTLTIDHNAYVGAANFVDDPTTGGDDTVSFWRDYRDALSPMYYYVDGSPDMSNWQFDTGLDQNSAAIDNADYRAPSAQNADSCPLWGASAPFWGAPTRCATGSDSSFETSRRWRDGLEIGDRLEWNGDGVLREITAIDNGSGDALDGCQFLITFDLPLGAPVEVGDWFYSYSAQSPQYAGKQFRPERSSTIIDAGDSQYCGHRPMGGGCDIGPVEYAPGQMAGVLARFDDPSRLAWTEATAANGYAVFRGDLADLRDADGDDLPDGGYGDCIGDPGSSANVTLDDHQVPPVGTGFFYVISMDTAVSVHDGLGRSSADVDRGSAVNSCQ